MTTLAPPATHAPSEERSDHHHAPPSHCSSPSAPRGAHTGTAAVRAPADAWEPPRDMLRRARKRYREKHPEKVRESRRRWKARKMAREAK